MCGAVFCSYTLCPVIFIPALLLCLLPKTNSNKTKVTMDTWTTSLFFFTCQCYWNIPLLNLRGGSLLLLPGSSRLWMTCGKETMLCRLSWKKKKATKVMWEKLRRKTVIFNPWLLISERRAVVTRSSNNDQRNVSGFSSKLNIGVITRERTAPFQSAALIDWTSNLLIELMNTSAN